MKSTGSAAARAVAASSTVIRATQSAGDARAPEKFLTMLEMFLCGRRDLAAVRREIAHSLRITLEPAMPIELALDRARDSNQLTAADHAVLLADVHRITTEETPTDVRVAPTAATKPAPTLEPGLGAVLNGRYQLEELVSDGPMGKVFRASDLFKRQAGTTTALAIKMLNPELRADPDALVRLQQEAFQVQRLSHTNIINVFDFDRTGLTDFITMEWLEGETLAALLDRTRPHAMDPGETKRIVAGVVAGLSHAHAQGIVHGDIKPANIFLCRDQAMKVIDFGTVRGRMVKTKTGAAYALTPGYASCELLEGNEPCPQDDVYALACTLYRMVTGFRPYGQLTALQAEAGKRVPRKPDTLTHVQWRVLQHGLAFRKQNRLRDVDSLLQIFLQKEPGTTSNEWLTPAMLGLAAGVLIGAVGQLAMDNPGADPATSAATARDVAEPIVALRAPAQVEPQIQSMGGRPSSGTAPVEEVTAPLEPGAIRISPGPAAPGAEPAGPAIEEVIDASTAETPAKPKEAEPSPTSTATVATETALPPDPTTVATEAAPPGVAAAVEPAPPFGPAGFTRQRVEVSESAGFVRLTVRAPADLATELPVRIVIESGSAIAGQDFVAPTRHQLEFTPDAREEIVLIPLIADAKSEYIEDFSVRLEVPEQELRFENTSVVVIIEDDD
ncbi:MAG: protein kinase [Gammaproteobacteria bacterium]|nr:protein kinase [Gammaproteobacteria bacterium]